jgi:hypothetical protein
MDAGCSRHAGESPTPMMAQPLISKSGGNSPSSHPPRENAMRPAAAGPRTACNTGQVEVVSSIGNARAPIGVAIKDLRVERTSQRRAEVEIRQAVRVGEVGVHLIVLGDRPTFRGKVAALA